ncbi:RING/U-box [Coprinellus micaceus]|uniref:RING/U-box n=1 Tax=Coprinellus micaceus TaxID=71717 RepID=A0A4Y7TZC9_COPMI|nr:RING/U-box [Coprinellus micaceus]
MSENEYDDLPDDFADIDGVDWEQVLSTTTYPQRSGERPQQSPSRPTENTTGEAHPATPNSDYFGDDTLDESALAEIDAIEHRFTQQAQAGPSRQVPAPHRGGAIAKLRSTPVQDTLKRLRSGSPSPQQPSKKGKTRAGDSTPTALDLLAEMEDEYTCPVCFDLLVAAHVANPCGHSFCGDCGRQWATTARKVTCPICRTALSRSAKVIPNIALQNAVEKYTELLAKADHAEWKLGGAAYTSWSERKQKWKEQALAHRKKAPPEPAFGRVIDLTSVFLDFNEDDEELDPTYDDGSGLIPAAPRNHPRRPYARTRSVRTGVFPV